jgi:hypothetical protein
MQLAAFAMLVAAFTPHMTSGSDSIAVAELGSIYGERECVARAERAFDRLREETSAGNSITDGWVVYQYDIGKSGSDAFIACVGGGAPVVQAFLSVHGSGAAIETVALRDRITALFTASVASR